MDAAVSISPAMRRRVVVSSIIGNALEWFDFVVYGMLAGIIAKAIFPTGDETSSLMVTLVTFGVGFGARPFGGIFLGMYSDKHGRKAAMVLMIFLMALGTLMVGLCPSYSSVGIVAPMFMLVARLVQGFSVGGEFSSATAMLIEFAPPGRRGLYGSFQMCSQMLAFIFGGLFAMLLSKHLDPETMESWGWRVPFLVGSLIGPIGIYLRHRVDESPEFISAMKARPVGQKMSFRQSLLKARRELFVSFCTISCATSFNYVLIVFIPLFAVQNFGFKTADTQLGVVLANLINLILIPFTGLLSDKIGRRTTMIPAIVVFCILAYVFMTQLIAEPTLPHLLCLQMSIVVMTLLFGPGPALMSEIFPVQVRSTAIALSYNIGILLFGGLAPAMVTGLVKETGDNMSPIYFMFATGAMGVVGLLLWKPVSTGATKQSSSSKTA